jgi:hypothetical protein
VITTIKTKLMTVGMGTEGTKLNALPISDYLLSLNI